MFNLNVLKLYVTASSGILFKEVSMSYLLERIGWNDLLGQLIVKNPGSYNAPSFGLIGGGPMGAYAFTSPSLKEAFIDFHVDHKYSVGTNMFIHMHWLPNTADAGYFVKWYFQIAYAKGYNRAPMSIGSLIEVDVTTETPGVQYQHMISEVQFSNDGGTGGLLDTNIIETDGIFMVRAYRNANIGSDNYNATVWGLYCDIHFQSDQISTKNRNFPFEGP